MIGHFLKKATDGDRKRSWALAVICISALIGSVDGTIVYVALPSIRSALHLSPASLVWVVNAHLLAYAGALLLSGRLGDIFGRRRCFLIGIALCMVGSVGCGFSKWSPLFLVARAAQGIGGAVIATTASSIILNLFTDAGERAKALGLLSFVGFGSQSLALLFGSALMSVLDWRWIFLVNVPICGLAYLLGRALLPEDRSLAATVPVDVAGAITVTISLMLALRAIVNVGDGGRAAGETLALLGSSAVFLIIFFVIEARVSEPLIPLGLLRHRNLVVANLIGMLMDAAMFSWGFMSTSYLQLVLGYSPLRFALASLPASVIIAAFCLGPSASAVSRFGIKRPLTIGLLLIAFGLMLFARAPVNGTLALDVLPGMFLIGIGIGMASTPLTLAAVTGLSLNDSGVACGISATSAVMGGLIGLALAVSIAAVRTKDLLLSGESVFVAQNGGYHLAFLLGAVFALAATFISATLLRNLQGLSANSYNQDDTVLSVTSGETAQ
jgi:MFS family permease